VPTASGERQVTGTPLTERRLQPKKIGESLAAVVVRAAIVSVPWVVRIIIRRVVSVIFRLGGVNLISGVVNVGTAAKQKSKSHGGDQRKDRYNVPTLFPFRCHAFGALI
jgi:hypothetical protein